MNLNYHLLTTIPFFILTSIGLYGLFKKAGKTPWKAFIPFYRLVDLLEIVGRPKWWFFLFLVPVLNLIMYISVFLDLGRSFGKRNFIHEVLVVIFPFFYLPYIGLNKTDTYQGPWALVEDRPKKSEAREWGDAILFAGTAAIIIRALTIEAFMIPTTSMEGSLLAGDFLFVSKVHYGVRLPMVPVSIPFIHNQIPKTEAKSYLPFYKLPYARIPGFKEVERNDIVVFNYPGDDEYPDVPEIGKVEEISMKQNYIKRCVAIPGDVLEIKNKVLHINGEPGWESPNNQYQHIVVTNNLGFSKKKLKEWGFRMNNSDNDNVRMQAPNHYYFFMNKEKSEFITGLPYVSKVIPSVRDSSQIDDSNNGKYRIYPKNTRKYPWNIDHFGPITIPKKGVTIQLSPNNIEIYQRAITAYEKHDLEIKGGKFIIDGKETNSYTFEMDYYFMMGDNRHSSLDSRYWGFVPEDHIVGRPLMVLFSYEDGIRWERLFTPISNWEPKK